MHTKTSCNNGIVFSLKLFSQPSGVSSLFQFYDDIYKSWRIFLLKFCNSVSNFWFGTLIIVLWLNDSEVCFNLFQVQTKDGYLLALQRVSSPTVNLGSQPGPPVLLLHGLFMVIFLLFLQKNYCTFITN